MADRVTVQSAEIVPYQIDATLYVYPGPESEPIRQASEQKLQSYISAQHRLGRDIRLSAIYAALHVEGVQRVELASPQADIVLSKSQASNCTEHRITIGAQMSDRLLPVGSSPLEVAAAAALAEIQRVPVPLRTLWNWRTCPVNLLPYLAWALSVDRWDETWPGDKAQCLCLLVFVHQHKGTISALRRVVEPLGYLIEVREWWKLNEEPCTFRLVVGVLDSGITEEMYQELERLIEDAKPASRHLTGLAISLSSTGELYVGAACYHGDALTVYPYLPEEIIVGGGIYPASAIHLIDNLRVNA